MKTLVFAALLTLSLFTPTAWAGAQNCTDVTQVTTDQTYYATDSDCIIQLTNPDPVASGAVAVPVILPAETGSAGSSEFTVVEASSYFTDFCGNYDNGNGDPNPANNVFTVCNPNGWTVESASAGDGVTVSGSTSDTMAGEYEPPNYARNSTRYVWDGVSNWAPQ
jgi:hypothetical protein